MLRKKYALRDSKTLAPFSNTASMKALSLFVLVSSSKNISHFIVRLNQLKEKHNVPNIPQNLHKQ